MHGSMIISARKKLKMSRSMLAKEVGVDESTVYRWEVGETKPSIDSIISMSKVLDKPIDWFI